MNAVLSRSSLVWITHVVLILCHCFGMGLSAKSIEAEVWQDCDYFLAPSTTGWGCYAARSFEPGEIVSIAPLFLPSPSESPGVHHTVLDDYVYGYTRPSDRSHNAVVIFGPDMFYNHHPHPNVKYSRFRGKEGSKTNASGFVAKRRIAAGEELFSSYALENGGREWFTQRGMEMQAPDGRTISSENLPHFQAECCSKIAAGVGVPTWKNEIDQEVDLSRLAPFDAGLGNARAKVGIARGQRIEISTGLVMSRKMIQGSAVSALVLSWEDLKPDHQRAIRMLQQSGQIKLQYQSPETSWKRIDRFETFEDLAILPAGGNIGMVRRVGDAPSNCRLVIYWQGTQQDSVGLTLELVATHDIASGDLLTLNLPPAGTVDELTLLKRELAEVGQPYYDGYFIEVKDEL